MVSQSLLKLRSQAGPDQHVSVLFIQNGCFGANVCNQSLFSFLLTHLKTLNIDEAFYTKNHLYNTGAYQSNDKSFKGLTGSDDRRTSVG